MSPVLRSMLLAAFGAVFSSSSWAQTATDIVQPPAVLPVESEAAAKLIAYPPLPAPLARGVVIIQYRTENVRIVPIFGKTAAEVSPRLGHLHVTVDDWHGTWAHTSGDPIIVVGLQPGPHKVLLEVADPTHKILTSTTVSFTVPDVKKSEAHAR